MYIDYTSVDVKPNPRALYMMGKTLYDNGNYNEAREYWDICAHYNEAYGTDYALNTQSCGFYIVKSREAIVILDNERPILNLLDKYRSKKNG